MSELDPLLSAANVSIDGIAARTLAWLAAFAARSRKPRYDGTAIASRMPMMMMTTRSSIRVKPCSPFASRRFRSAVSIWCVSFRGDGGSAVADPTSAVGHPQSTPRTGEQSPTTSPTLGEWPGTGREQYACAREAGDPSLKFPRAPADSPLRDRHDALHALCAALDRHASRSDGRPWRVRPPPHRGDAARDPPPGRADAARGL